MAGATTQATSALPKTVRCIRQPDTNDSRSCTLALTTRPIQLPSPYLHEHLIRVHAFAICAGELTWQRDFPGANFPERIAIPGYDVAGTVVQSPAGSAYPPGTEIFAHADAGFTGNAQDYSIVRGHELVRKPASLSWVQAASVPLSALTAWQALFEHGGLGAGWKFGAKRLVNAGKRVIITAAAGGVGIWAVQLAKLAGVGEIVAVVGSGNVDFVKSLGATEVVDYKKQSLGDWVRAGNKKADLVLDMVGGETLAQAWTAVAENGNLICVHEYPDARKPTGEGFVAKNIRSCFFILEPRSNELQEIADLIEWKKLTPYVDSEWPFEQFREAWAKSDEGHCRGKVVVKL